MSFADNPLIRRTLAPQPSPDLHAEPRERLWRALLQFRERAATLANEIHRDLPDFTVHDITHLDALWEMADLIAGPDYPLNPLEAFALGAVFLLHDLGLGLAAWPGGLGELKQGPGWQDALSTYLRKHLERIPTTEELASPPPEVERMAIQERLRVLHAEQAERLALASWHHKGGPEYHLIEDPDLRETIGPLLGKIAHSHWWPVSRLGNEFGTVRGALTYCPRDWTLDPLKIAVLLRTADAAHLDARRAPGFLIALRRPEGISEEHWRFQNHLLKPRVEDDRLIYTTANPFLPEEADAWWLCEETLRMVDREFHQVDALLADRGVTPRLRVGGVAGVESPNRLQKYVGVSGWTPVDARLHVSNVADLAGKLGGEQLYGDDPTVPLRELIQNASDAVRARRLLEDRPSNWGRVTVRLGRDDEGPWVEVEDTGIGMSEAVLTGSLLDFGTTYWGSGLMREEHEGLWAKGFEPTGRFGIGFFSVFMWGHRVRVTTRRYDDGQRDTRILDFRTGLTTRPLVRPAEPKEQRRDGGTCVRVWMNKEPAAEGGLLHLHKAFSWSKGSMNLGALCAWLAPALDVDLFAESAEESRCVVSAFDWIRLDEIELIARLTFGAVQEKKRYKGSLLGQIKDSNGKLLGRGVLLGEWIINSRKYSYLPYAPYASIYELGVVTIGGLRSGNMTILGRFRAQNHPVEGFFIGSSVRASRDRGVPAADRASLAAWASDQAKLAAAMLTDIDHKMMYAAGVVAFGGNPGSLPIAKMGDIIFESKAVVDWKEIPDEVLLVHVTGDLADKEIYGPNWPRCIMRLVSEDLFSFVEELLARAWGCSFKKIKSDGIHVSLEFEGKDVVLSGVIVKRPASGAH
jgi:hypothetical protein